MDSVEFNAVVTSKAMLLKMGVDPQEIAADLVTRFGEEQAFLLLNAARAYAKLEFGVQS